MAGLAIGRGWRGLNGVCREHGGGLVDWRKKLGQGGFRGSDVEVCCDFAESGSLKLG